MGGITNKTVHLSFAVDWSKEVNPLLVYKEKKIVLIHFAAECGGTGAILARCLKERFYQSILKQGKTLGKNEFTFMVGDEFQEILDVSKATNCRFLELLHKCPITLAVV